MSEHTSEPWIVSTHLDGFGIATETEQGNYWIADCIPNQPDGATEEDNARRIVACVNACAGLDDPEFVIQSMKQRIESISFCASAITLAGLEQQRNKLLEALKAFMALDEEFSTAKRKHVEEIAQAGGKMAQAVLLARDAIAEVEASK